MRVLRQKHNRKTLLYFKLTYGIDSPYHVVLDGNFIYQALRMDIDIMAGLQRLLQSDDIVLWVPTAVLTELEALGPKFEAALAFARTCGVLADPEIRQKDIDRAMLAFDRGEEARAARLKPKPSKSSDSDSNSVSEDDQEGAAPDEATAAAAADLDGDDDGPAAAAAPAPAAAPKKRSGGARKRERQRRAKAEARRAAALEAAKVVRPDRSILSRVIARRPLVGTPTALGPAAAAAAARAEAEAAGAGSKRRNRPVGGSDDEEEAEGMGEGVGVEDGAGAEAQPAGKALRGDMTPYVVATLDRRVLKELRTRSGVPLVTLNRNVLVLEDVSKGSQMAADKAELAKQGVDGETRRMMAAFHEKVSQEAKALAPRGAEVPRKKKRRTGPKQPNPLSMRKKQPKERRPNQQQQQQQQQGRQPGNVAAPVAAAKSAGKAPGKKTRRKRTRKPASA